MLIVTFTELRNNAKKYFDKVEQGDSIEIYRNGKPIAILSSYKTRTNNRWKNATPLKMPGVSLSQVIIDERNEEK